MGLFDFAFGKQDKEPYSGRTLDNKPLYNLTDEENEYIGKFRFVFLGTHGRKDKKSYNNIQKAIKDMGYTDKVLFLKNNPDIMKFGVIETPALVVDGKVVTYGTQFELEYVKELLKNTI